MIDQAEMLAEAFKLGKNSLVHFREIFLPVPDDVTSAPFHHEWSQSLLNGHQHELWECYRESAKALALDTKVPTPNGFTTIGQIKEGDIIYDENGKETKVLMLSPIFTDHDCFKITFDDKTEVIADGGHRWLVWDKQTRQSKVVDTYEIYVRNKSYSELSYSIPCQFKDIKNKHNEFGFFREIIKVEKVAPVPVRCLMVDSPTHLFLITDRYIPTHNTSYIIRAHMIYRLVYPSTSYDYIVIIKATQKDASKKLKEIAAEYLSNPILCSNLVAIKENTEKGFEVDVKDENNIITNVRIEAYGKGSAVRGLNYKERRPKLVVLDDPQDLEDSQSDTVQDNDWDWFLSDVYFLGMGCRIFMTANNLGEKCLAERIIANAKSLKFTIHKVAVMDEDGNPSWPAKNTIEQIEQEREDFRAIGKLSIWFQNKMCLSMSPEDQVFTKEMFRYYKPNTFSHSGMSVYTTVDWAYSEKSTSDFRAIVTAAVNSDNHWFILDVQYGRWNVDTMIDKLFETVQKYKPIFVGIEAGAYKAAIQPFIIKEMPKRNIWFSIKELIADRKKTLRINQIQPRFVAGTVWFPENASWLTEMESELLGFTMSGSKSLHDDLVDAMAYLEQIAIPPTNSWGSFDEKKIPIMGSI